MVVATVGGVLIAVMALFVIARARRGSAGATLPMGVEDLFEAGPDALLVVDRNGVILAANRLVAALFGWPAAELRGQPLERLLPQSLRLGRRVLCRDAPVGPERGARGSSELNLSAVRRDGSTFPVEVILSPLAAGVAIAAVRDATDRQAKAAEILSLNRIYSTLAEAQQLVGRCADELELFERVCHVAVTAGEFTLAWIGRPDPHGAVVSLASRAAAAEFDEYLRGLAVHIDAARPEGRGPFGVAWREARAVFVQDFRCDERVAFWRRPDRPAPWGASAALPIRCGDRIHAVLSLYDTRPGAFSDKVVDLLYRMVMHIEYALDRLALVAEKKDKEERICRLLNFDALTALPNRRCMLEHLEHAVGGPGHTRTHGGVLLLGLDRFQTINDILGHHTGDRLLQETARRLRAAVPGAGLAGRVGGDEFLVVLEDLGAEPRAAVAAARGSAERLLAAVLQPHLIDDRIVSCSVSIGIALWGGQSAVGFQEPLRRAQVAMRAAKNNGRNTSRLFTPGMQLALERRSRLEARLRHEFNTDQLELYFQRRVGGDGATHGAEALLRWHDPRRGLVSPIELVPVAEEIGLIHEIGRWVLGRACRQLKEWSQCAPARRLRLAVNVSPKQLADDAFVDQVIDILARTGADPHLLELEVTEGLPIQDIEEVIPKMQALRGLGMRFAIDDFGIGYSSLSYLRQLPISVLKIDRSFVAGMAHPGGETLVHTIVQMARSLELTVIAEGVEARWQWEMLMLHGCDQYQGYLFGRPVPIEVFDRELLAAPPEDGQARTAAAQLLESAAVPRAAATIRFR